MYGLHRQTPWGEREHWDGRSSGRRPACPLGTVASPPAEWLDVNDSSVWWVPLAQHSEKEKWPAMRNMQQSTTCRHTVKYILHNHTADWGWISNKYHVNYRVFNGTPQFYCIRWNSLLLTKVSRKPDSLTWMRKFKSQEDVASLTLPTLDLGKYLFSISSALSNSFFFMKATTIFKSNKVKTEPVVQWQFLKARAYI